ncbi:MAG TPA: PilN domain-containing protein, partial [Casimicrobiaceae bacterium]|nr:PilN domain-containing protein [Casimicrobiaceae bacterium]
MAAVADSTSFNKPGYARDVARRLGLTGFGHWWARELAALMPSRLRAAVAHRHARPLLAFEGAQATLWRPVTSAGQVTMVESARIALDGDPATVAAGGRAALAPLTRGANGGAPEVVIALSPRASLRKRLTLPAAIEPNLHQALAYDLDRHTPFKSDELYFDAAIADRDPANNTLHVDLAAARRAIVDPMLRHAESFGARVVGITVDPPAVASTSRLDLLPVEREDRTERSRWRVIVPLLLLAIAILVALVLPVWQKREQAIALNQLSDQARQRAGASDALRTELERKTSEYNFALERKYAFPGTVQVLDDITHLLPDDTWLTQLEVRSVRGKEGQRELTLRGESANAGRLVSLLEDSKLFTQAAPRSPTTKIQPGPGEIFDVGAQLKPAPMPQPAPLDLTAPPPQPPQRPRANAATQQPNASAAAPLPGTPTPPNAAGAAAANSPPTPAANRRSVVTRSAPPATAAAPAGTTPQPATAAAPA